MAPATRLVTGLVGGASLLLLVGCGGSDDDSASPTTTDAVELSAGDADATLTFVDAELVWAIDGEPVGSELSYAEAIERDRFDAGIRWELRFDADGDVGDLDIAVVNEISINGNLMEVGRNGSGPEEAVVIVREPFTASEVDGQVLVSVDVGRPISPSTLGAQRAFFEELTGVDADADQVALGDDFEFNVDELVEFPPMPTDGVNRYEYAARGVIALGNGTEVDVSSALRLAVRDADPVAVDLSGSCGDLAGQFGSVVGTQMERSGFVLIGESLAARSVLDAAEELGCTTIDFELPACSAARALVEETGGDPELQPWSEALEVCPSGRQLQEVTTIRADRVDGVLRMVAPATADGLLPLAVAMSVPPWAWQAFSGDTWQYVDFDGLGADRVREAWFRVDLSTVSESFVAERFVEAVTPEPDAGAEVARWEGEITGARGDVDGASGAWVVAGGDGDYAFGGAIRLDEERLLTLEGLVLRDEGRNPTDESVTELASCLIESVVIEDWTPDAAPAPVLDCSATGTFEPEVAEVPEGDQDAEAAGGGSEAIAEVNVSESGVLTIPIQNERGDILTIGASVPGWALEPAPAGIEAQLVGAGPGEVLTFDVVVTPTPIETIDELTQPTVADPILYSEPAEWRGDAVEVVAYNWFTDDVEALSAAAFGVPLSDERVLIVSSVAPVLGSIAPNVVLFDVLTTLLTVP